MNSKASWMARLDQTGVPAILARLGIGGLFMVMAWNKIQAPVTFLKLMRQYEMFDEQTGYMFMNLIVVILPWLELICGLILILGVAVRAAGLISAGMLAVFTPMILMRGLELFQQGQAETFCGLKFDCGCGSGPVYVCWKLAENSLLFLGCIILIASRSNRFCLPSLFKKKASEQPASLPSGAGD